LPSFPTRRSSDLVDVPRAFEGFVGAYAIEVPAQAAVMRFDLARQVGQQLFESGLRVDAWINDDFAAQHHARGFFQESERETGMEGEVVLPVFAAPGKADLHGLFQRC